MGLCAKCNCVLPPNYLEIIENSKPDFHGDYPKECVFCKLMISSVERETSSGSNEYMEYKKEDCIKDYQKFLNKLKHSKSVKDILKKADGMGGFK
jgi:hypothetical protein